MGKFFKIAKKRIHNLDKPKKRQKTHAGKGALIGGAALGAKEAWHIKQVNTPGSKARQKFKEYVKMDSKRKVPIIDRKHAKKINKVGWKIKDVLRVSNKQSVALIGGVGALLGAIVGESVKKPLEKKASVKYIPNKKLEDAVTSRIALEGTQDKKTMDNLKYYNKVKNSWMTPDIVIRKAEDHLIQKNKKKHGKFIYDTFGNIPDDKYKELALRSIKKMNKGYENMRNTHYKDSMALVNSGQEYPKPVDDYFNELKRKKALKESLASK